MPINYRFIRSKRLILAKGTDPLTDADCSLHAHSVLTHPDFKPGFVELLDLRKATAGKLTSEGVFQTARAVKPHMSRLVRSKLAIVAAEEVMYGMARMYQLFIGEIFENIHAFRNIGEALDFIGLSLSAFHSLKSENDKEVANGG
jgi:hypothetical protein